MNFEMIMCAVIFIGCIIGIMVLFIHYIKTMLDLRYKKEACTEEIMAEVIGYHKKTLLRYGGYRYMPILEYEYNGVKYVHKAKRLAFVNDAREHEIVSIYIDAKEPDVVYEGGESDLYTPLVACALSVFVLGMMYVLGGCVKYLLFGL